MFNEYPYRNLTDLNLDYILKQIRYLTKQITDFVSLNTIKYANPIRWDIAQQYEKNTVVIDGNTGTAYLSVQPVPKGVTLQNANYWTVIFTLDILGGNHNITEHDAGSNLTATFASNEDDWLLWNMDLYRVTRPIIVNEAYLEGYNLTRITVEDFVRAMYSEITTNIGDLTDLNTTDKSSVVNAINEVLSSMQTLVGSLTDLTTTDKTNIVSAVNEVVSSLTTLSNKIGDITELDTTDKTNLVNAINEIVSSVSTIDTNIGDLANLDTTDKSSIVAAINEVFQTGGSGISTLINTKLTIYPTNADMIADTDLTVGKYVVTGGYSAVGDNGGCKFVITSSDDFNDIALSNGLYAHRIVDYIRPEQFGCVCDGVTDDYTAFNSACLYSIHYKLPLMIYNSIAVAGTITLDTWLTIEGAHDGATIIELNNTSLFEANNTIYFTTIKNLRLRGTNNTGVALNFNVGNDDTNFGTTNSDITNLDIESFGMGIRLTKRWLATRLTDFNIHNCGSGVYWAGYDGGLSNFNIWSCIGTFGGLTIVGAYNRFENGKIWSCGASGTNSGITLSNTGNSCISNMIDNVDVQDCYEYGISVSGKSHQITNVSLSENGHSGSTTSVGIKISGNYCIIRAACSNLLRGHEQRFGVQLGGSYNDIVFTAVDQSTAAYTGSVGTNYARSNGTVLT